MNSASGRHFLQIPGPTNLPDRILRAMDRPVIDHRGPEFAGMTLEILEGLGRIFRTEGEVLIWPSSGTGAWEAALANTTFPGDAVIAFDQGFFADKWCAVARSLGLEVEVLEGDWRHPVDPDALQDALAADEEHRYVAVLLVHNETSTGVTHDVAAVRKAIDAARHPALLMVDAVSSLGSIDLRQDEWKVDVVVAGSQKGLMLPPGLGFNSISPKALDVHQGADRSGTYWNWTPMLASNRTGYFPYTPATTLLYGLREAIAMLEEEGLDAVFARHARFGEATRAAVEAWGLETWCADPRAASASVTSVVVPDGHDADALRATILDRFDMSLGTGLGRLSGKVFRIGHLGDFNDLMLAGTLCGVEMGLELAGIPYREGGVAAALEVMAGAR